MAKRNYPKGAAKREQLLDVALETIATSGYNAATIRGIAEQAGISKTGVGHHFASKYDLLTAVLSRRDEEGVRATQAALPELFFDTIRGVLAQESSSVGLTELYVRLSAEATDPANVAHPFFLERYEQLDEFGAVALSALQNAGQAPKGMDSKVLATLLQAVVDGLQLRLLYSPLLDQDEIVDTMRRLLESAAKAENAA